MARIKFLIPFGINQMGSVLYMYVLGKVPAQYCSILANRLTSLITLITEGILNKDRWTLKKFIGIGLILMGLPLVLS
jgi:drug/metabolite transporter (DMT)-like permease